MGYAVSSAESYAGKEVGAGGGGEVGAGGHGGGLDGCGCEARRSLRYGSLVRDVDSDGFGYGR